MASLASKTENLILIWLDQNIDTTSDEVRNSIRLFQSFINTIQFFSNPHECQQFLEEIIDEKLFLIISGSFGEKLVPTIEIKPQIFAIYVYCHQRDYHEKWTKDYSKVKGVYTDLQSISDAFRRDFRQANNDLLSIDLLPRRNSNQLLPCSLLLTEILINTPLNGQMKKELIEYSRFHYNQNPIQLDLIDQYERSDYNQITSIEWYTRECFIYAMINRALRLYDVKLLNKIAFFMQDLNQQIQDLYTKSTDSKNFTVYYGQGLSNDQLDKLKMNIDGLMSFNSFLLTTIDRELSLHSAKQSGESISILYRIEIDRSKSSTPFVALDQLDYYHDTDQHILFSLDSVFRILHIEHLEEKVWQINLILTDLPDQTGKSKGLFSLGQMLFKTNQLTKAKNIFEVLLQDTKTINQKELISVHRMLGRIYQKTEDFASALLHYQECLKTESSSDLLFSVALAGIGAILEKLGNLNQALEYFKRAAGNQTIKPSILAFYYISIGRILYKQGENIEARKNWELALKFEQKSLVHNDHFLAEIHHYLTLVS